METDVSLPSTQKEQSNKNNATVQPAQFSQGLSLGPSTVQPPPPHSGPRVTPFLGETIRDAALGHPNPTQQAALKASCSAVTSVLCPGMSLGST